MNTQDYDDAPNHDGDIPCPVCQLGMTELSAEERLMCHEDCIADVDARNIDIDRAIDEARDVSE